jgi:hypothetical protein
MTSTIKLTAAEEDRLKAAASANGLAPEELARQLVNDGLPGTDRIAEMNRRISEWQRLDGTISVGSTQGAALMSAKALFAQWAEEDAKLSDEERAENDRIYVEPEVIFGAK